MTQDEEDEEYGFVYLANLLVEICILRGVSPADAIYVLATAIGIAIVRSHGVNSIEGMTAINDAIRFTIAEFSSLPPCQPTNQRENPIPLGIPAGKIKP